MNIAIERLAGGYFKWIISLEEANAQHLPEVTDMLSALRHTLPHAQGADCDAACATWHNPIAMQEQYTAPLNAKLYVDAVRILSAAKSTMTQAEITARIDPHPPYLAVRDVLRALEREGRLLRGGPGGRLGYTYEWVDVSRREGEIETQ